MFASEVCSAFLYSQITALPEAAGFSVIGLPVNPPYASLPGIAFYPEVVPYSGVIGARADTATPRFVIKAMCEGTSTDPIRAVAKAIQDRFENTPLNDYTYQGGTYSLTFDLNSEALPTTVVEGAQFYRQLGSVFNIFITQTGG